MSAKLEAIWYITAHQNEMSDYVRNDSVMITWTLNVQVWFKKSAKFKLHVLPLLLVPAFMLLYEPTTRPVLWVVWSVLLCHIFLLFIASYQ